MRLLPAALIAPMAGRSSPVVGQKLVRSPVHKTRLAGWQVRRCNSLKSSYFGSGMAGRKVK